MKLFTTPGASPSTNLYVSSSVTAHAVASQPESAVASSSSTSALLRPDFCYPPSISRLNGISVSVWASALPPLHSRDQQTSMQHEIASARASPQNPGRHLPASVLPLASPPREPLPSPFDQARGSLLTSNGARNKPGR